MQENFAAQIKKPAGGKARNPRPATLMKQHYILSTMTRAPVNLPQNTGGRVYHSKVHHLPHFFPIRAEKMHFFSEKCKI